MVSQETKLKALIRVQDKLAELDAIYLTSKIMKESEYKVRRHSLRLAFNKLKNDTKK